MRRGEMLWLGGVLGLLLLGGCARSTPTPVVTPEEELPPPVTVSIPFNVSPVEPPTAERPPSLYLNPASVSLEVGGTITVQVWADGVGGVRSLLLEVGFDPQMVRIVDADPAAEGVQAAPGDLMGLVLENRVEGDRLVYRATVLPDMVGGEAGILVSLPLQAMAPGVTSLRMEQVIAQDGEGNPVAVTSLADGIITIAGASPSPTAGASLSAPPSPTVPVTPGPSGAGGIYYVVGPGENLFRIGLKFGTTAQAIAAANHIADPRQVPAGAMVLVPVPAPGGGYGYYVRPGDTVYSIARRFGMTVEELANLNGIGPDFTIRSGTILKVVPGQ